MNTLKAERRDMTIKAKKLRREGFVTGSIFGREMEETIPLKMEKGAVERLLKEEGKGGSSVRVGSMVKHGVFGQGRVSAISGSGDNTKITVMFANGTKRVFILRFAPLEIL